MITKMGMGDCPKCGSFNIEYLDMDDTMGEFLVHSVHCKDCGFDFYEYERIAYAGYSYTDENGNDHDFDAEGKKLC